MDRHRPTQDQSPPISSFRVSGYPFLWLAGWLWHVARWMVVFITTYRVNAQTGDPLLVQLVGTFFMAPMFLGGALVGTVTDRLDQRRTVRTTLGVLVPLAGMMGVAVAFDRAPVVVSYAFVFCVGAGNVVDMTSRRAIAFGLVGPTLITNAAAFETLALHGGNTVGSLTGGAVVAAFGPVAVHLAVALVYLAALGSFLVAGRQAQVAAPVTRPRSGPGSVGRPTVGADLGAGFGLLRSHPVLRQFLVTTVVMNFFYYAFMPLVPVFAEDLGVGPFLTGLLASALGLGTMTGAVLVARIQPARRGLLHIAGSLGAMTMLAVFANMTWYPAAVAALYLAGLFGAGFGTTQSALVVSLVEEDLRGRALGVLSMAIGALPFGMFTLGLLARRTNPQVALTVSVGLGFVLLLGWQARRPHLRELR